MGGRRRDLGLTFLSPLLLFRLEGDSEPLLFFFCSLACTLINLVPATFFLKTSPFIYQQLLRPPTPHTHFLSARRDKLYFFFISCSTITVIAAFEVIFIFWTNVE